MPEAKDLLKGLGRPQTARLKQLGSGIKITAVLGNRVLIKTIQPYTDLDRVEKEGLLYVPEGVKKDNTPMPSTGIIVMQGDDVVDTRGRLGEGTAVMFSKFAGSDFVVDEQDFKILDVPEIMAVLGMEEAAEPVMVKAED